MGFAVHIHQLSAMALSEGMSETLGAAVLLGTHLPKEEGAEAQLLQCFHFKEPSVRQTSM